MSQSKRIANKIRSSKTGELALSVLVALGLAKTAQAQSEGSADIESIDSVAGYEILPDETIRITLENGETLTLGADAYEIVNGQVFLTEVGLSALSASLSMQKMGPNRSHSSKRRTPIRQTLT